MCTPTYLEMSEFVPTSEHLCVHAWLWLRCVHKGSPLHASAQPQENQTAHPTDLSSLFFLLPKEDHLPPQQPIWIPSLGSFLLPVKLISSY